MRIQAITEVNTRKQQNPYLTQNADYVTIGKDASLVSFEECLRTQMQSSQHPAVSRRAEWMATSSIWGYFMTQEASRKSELRLKERAYESMSDL